MYTNPIIFILLSGFAPLGAIYVIRWLYNKHLERSNKTKTITNHMRVIKCYLGAKGKPRYLCIKNDKGVYYIYESGEGWHTIDGGSADAYEHE
jgi:hypothetical protein